MYTEEEEYEEYKSRREDLEFMDRYMDTLDSLLDEEIRRHNQSLVEDEKREQDKSSSISFRADLGKLMHFEA